MRFRACFLVLLFSSCGSFAQLQVTVFTGVSQGCDKTVIAPNSTIDVGSAPVGVTVNEGLCLMNTGASPITVSGITVTGADFTSTANLLPLIVQPNTGSPLVAGFAFAPTSAGVRTGQISFVDDASGSPQAFTLSGTGFTDFGLNTLVPAANTQTVTAGQTASYNMTVSGAGAFNGNIGFSCSNLPQGTKCMFSPEFLSLRSGDEFGNFGLNVSTTARPAAYLHSPGLNPWYSLAAMFALALGASRRSLKRLSLLVCLMLLSLTISCGDGSSGPTPAGTFQFSVNAMSNGVTHSKTMVLVVN